ncbi:MAG TPA: sugar phosphate isomerase/epimerase [Candidatus Methylomirabilis sp.]|nr:sugar phosphate isomerase/epimerase [Candidatus Methylomirabilis sp.]HSB82532.1 sugar phosphate isomerase/epimerase [Candidatus Methylomirabilis sp.]
MKIGIFTALFQDRPLEEVLKLVAELGYDMVELPAWRGNGHVDLDAVLGDGGRALRDLVKRHGLAISALNNGREGHLVLGPHDWTVDRWAPVPNTEERIRYGVERLRQTARAAAALEVPVVAGFVGSPVWDKWYTYPSTNEQAYEQAWELFAERVNPILDEFARCGVRFALEVHPTEMAYNLEMAEHALEVLDGRSEFGFNFDPSHLVWQSIDPVVFIKCLGKRIFHCHAKDGEVQEDEVRRSGVLSSGSWTRPDRGFRFRVPGWGDVNWRRVMSALVATGYDYVLSFEHEDPVMSPEDGCEKAIAFLRPLLIRKPLAGAWW